MQNQRLRAFIGFGWGLLLFFLVARCLRLGLGSIVSESPVVSQVVLKSALVFVALIGWKLLGLPFSEMGWRRADWWNQSYLVWFATAAASMMAGSVAVILLETRHPIAAQMRFLQIVGVIWLLSSFSEEVYVRGLVQSWMARGEVDDVLEHLVGSRLEHYSVVSRYRTLAVPRLLADVLFEEPIRHAATGRLHTGGEVVCS